MTNVDLASVIMATCPHVVFVGMELVF